MISTWREKAPGKEKFQLKTTQPLHLFQNVHRRHDFTVFFLGPAGDRERLCNDMAEYSKIKIVLYSSAVFLINDLTCDFPNLLGEQGVSHRRGVGHTSVHFECVSSATIQRSLNPKDLKVPQKKVFGETAGSAGFMTFDSPRVSCLLQRKAKWILRLPHLKARDCYVLFKPPPSFQASN